MKYLKENWGGWALYAVFFVLGTMATSGTPILVWIGGFFVTLSALALTIGLFQKIMDGSIFKGGRNTNWTDME
jgi:hypothetical protein